MKICIVTDDNAGFTKKELSKLKLVHVIRMPIIIDGEIFYEDETISSEKFYARQGEGADIRTSQPAPGEIINLWEKLLKEYDQIVHIPMTSGLSQECETAKMLAEDYPGKVFVVDNHRISVTLKSSIYDALALIEEGKDAKEIQEILTEEAFKSSIYIMVDTLTYLKKGGRVTAAGALLGSTFHIKPILTILGGKLDAYKKAIGTKKAKVMLIEAIQEDLANKFKDTPKEELIFSMAYTYNLDDAKEFKADVCNALGLKDEQVMLDPLSLSVATHIGPGSLATTISHKIAK